MIKNLSANVGRMGLIPGMERFHMLYRAIYLEYRRFRDMHRRGFLGCTDASLSITHLEVSYSQLSLSCMAGFLAQCSVCSECLKVLY